MAPPNQPVQTPMPQRLEDFKQRSLPLVVWSIATLVVLVMLIGRARQFEYIGIASSPLYEVSVQGIGTIDSVTVDLYDDVDTGDVVATLDDSQVVAAIETSRAGVRQLQAELESARTRLLSGEGQGTAEWVADLRRFQIDEEERRLEMLALKVKIESDQIELARLKLDLERNRPLLEQGLISQRKFDNKRLLHDRVSRRAEENDILLAETEGEYETARERRRSYESSLPEHPERTSVLAPLIEAVEVESRRLDEIELQRASLILRSPVVGQVSQILCRKGQSVVPGEPIVMISERSVREIVAYLSDSDSLLIEPDMHVRVASQANPGRVVESVVLRIGPTIEPLPQRLWRSANVPDYGRAVVIGSAPGMRLTPGEIVDVRFLAK